jgi:hypothetical protein
MILHRIFRNINRIKIILIYSSCNETLKTKKTIGFKDIVYRSILNTHRNRNHLAKGRK